MDKLSNFEKELKISKKFTDEYKFEYNKKFEFRVYTEHEIDRTKELLVKNYNALIKMRDNRGEDRASIIKDCNNMSIDLYDMLSEDNVVCEIIIGDVAIYDQWIYNTTYEYLREELCGIHRDSTFWHVWLVLDNYLLIDPTFLIKNQEKDDFLNYRTDSHLFHMDIRKPYDGLEFKPMAVGKHFLSRM